MDYCQTTCHYCCLSIETEYKSCSNLSKSENIFKMVCFIISSIAKICPQFNNPLSITQITGRGEVVHALKKSNFSKHTLSNTNTTSYFITK